MTEAIRFENVSKVFPGGVAAVRDLTLQVEEGETLVLLGTSGCGKTTTMKMVNRLLHVSAGRILVHGEDIAKQDPVALRKGIGYAIQHIGLFPHMTIAENIGVVPQLIGWSSERTREQVDRMLTLVGLAPDEFRDRYPNQLSGGQKQRVGVARALAADPPIVLMDEPFGALDPITREQLQTEFLELESRIRKTVLFVTHDVFEAVKMGDRIALLDGGRLQQLATPAEFVERPANAFAEQFLGQHRFQLSLLTRTVQGALQAPASGGAGQAAPPEGPVIKPHDSLIQALDLFKQTGAAALPVVEGDAPVGELTRRALLKAIGDAFDEPGEEASA